MKAMARVLLVLGILLVLFGFYLLFFHRFTYWTGPAFTGALLIGIWYGHWRGEKLEKEASED